MIMDTMVSLGKTGNWKTATPNNTEVVPNSFVAERNVALLGRMSATITSSRLIPERFVRLMV